MKKTIVIVGACLVVGALALVYSPKEVKTRETAVAPLPSKPAEAYKITVDATAISAYKVSLKIQTNIPLPVEVMAGVSIKGQKPTDTYIGVSNRVKLTSPEQVVIVDGTKENLPAGEYYAEVNFYPRWGAENGSPEAKAIKEEISAQADVTLTGSGASKTETDALNAAQKWVMENVVIGTPWDEKLFVSKLGSFTKSASDLNLHDAYYFEKSDMTIIVSRVKKTVAIWRMGRATK